MSSTYKISSRCTLLVLARKVDESVLIGDDIKLTILGIEGDKIKLGIDAPRSLTILRKELYEAIQIQEKLAKELARKESEAKQVKMLRDFLSETSSPSSEEK